MTEESKGQALRFMQMMRRVSFLSRNKKTDHAYYKAWLWSCAFNGRPFVIIARKNDKRAWDVQDDGNKDSRKVYWYARTFASELEYERALKEIKEIAPGYKMGDLLIDSVQLVDSGFGMCPIRREGEASAFIDAQAIPMGFDKQGNPK